MVHGRPNATSQGLCCTKPTLGPDPTGGNTAQTTEGMAHSAEVAYMPRAAGLFCACVSVQCLGLMNAERLLGMGACLSESVDCWLAPYYKTELY